MSDLMGKQHESAPVTDEDKVMSKRHKAHRKEIDKMKDGPDKLNKSISYNKSHMIEHREALVKSKDQLKAMKKNAKASFKMGR